MRTIRCPHCRREFAPTLLPSSELRRRVTVVVEHVARRFGVETAELRGHSRAPSVVRPRLVAYYVAKTVTRASYPELGRIMRRHHTTVRTEILRLRERAKTDDELRRTLDELVGELSIQERAA